MRLDQIKEILTKDKERLEKQIKYYESEDPFLIEDRDWTTTLDDDITENEGHDRITATKTNLVDQLAKVNNALNRLSEVKFGLCRKCGQKIPGSRLLIMPTADLCISCETKK